MADQLKTKVVRGFAWNVAEKIASALFQAWVTINVLNHLLPTQTAPVAILVAFSAIFNVLVDSGFSQALIRRSSPSATDFSSAFWFNIVASVAVYALLVGLAYPAAHILEMPEIATLAPVFYLIVPLSALGIIQQTVLTRVFDFRRLSAITFASIVGAGLVAVAMAQNGFGIWSLVALRVVQMALRAALLWIFGRWRPTRQFSGDSIRGMWGYSSRLLATDMLNNAYNSVPQFFMGHIDAATLGNYDTARKVRDLPVNSTMNSMQAVTFPALASLQNDDDKFAQSVGKVIGSIVFLMFPMMAGLIVVSGEIFGVFLSSNWAGAVLFFRILCLASFATPIAIVSYNILKTKSDGKAVLRSEIVKKIFATTILAATIPFGALAITWGVVVIAFSDAVVSFSIARRHSAYGLSRLAADVLPTLALTLFMAASVLGVGFLLDSSLPQALVLAIKIATGAGIYILGALLIGLPALVEFRKILPGYPRS